MKANLLLSTTMCFVLVSCTSVSSVAKEDMEGKAVEPLYSVSIVDNAIQFGVKSNGCTKPEDFKVVLEGFDSEALLSIVRTKIDRCRRMPTVIELTKSLDYSTIKPNLPIRLVNPLIMNTK